ncbi:MAG: zf-HC2 domain-containing protein [Gaiellales bacterium]
MIGSPGDRERSCARAREWASQRLDGELSELERLLLRRHLGRCTDCRAFAEGIESSAQAIRSLPVEAPSRPLSPEPVPIRPRHRARRRRLAVAVALVVVSGTLGGLLGGLLGSGDSPRPVTTIVELPPPPTATAPTGNV